MHIGMPLWLFAGVLGMAGAAGALLGELVYTAHAAVELAQRRNDER